MPLLVSPCFVKNEISNKQFLSKWHCRCYRRISRESFGPLEYFKARKVKSDPRVHRKGTEEKEKFNRRIKWKEGTFSRLPFAYVRVAIERTEWSTFFLRRYPRAGRGRRAVPGSEMRTKRSFEQESKNTVSPSLFFFFQLANYALRDWYERLRVCPPCRFEAARGRSTAASARMDLLVHGRPTSNLI